jgi:GNAT superfamily N-acetyltransferase
MLITDRNSIKSEKFTLAILETKEDFSCTKLCDCGDEDLNEFFRKDAFAHKKELLAETYYFAPNEATEKNLFFPVAFVSFLNDAIQITSEERKTTKKGLWKHLKRNIPYQKRGYLSFPAVKIGRLGVHKKYQRLGLGTSLLNMTKEYFLTNNRTGCRFLTVEAYNKLEVTGFYERNGFQFLWDEDKTKSARIMFFDLKRFKSET